MSTPNLKVVVLSSQDEFTHKEWEVLKIQMCKACTIAQSLKNCKFCSFNSLKLLEAEKIETLDKQSAQLYPFFEYA